MHKQRIVQYFDRGTAICHLLQSIVDSARDPVDAAARLIDAALSAPDCHGRVKQLNLTRVRKNCYRVGTTLLVISKARYPNLVRRHARQFVLSTDGRAVNAASGFAGQVIMLRTAGFHDAQRKWLLGALECVEG
jgi:hypothetical protein